MWAKRGLIFAAFLGPKSSIPLRKPPRPLYRARDIGKNGAVPNRWARYERYEKSGFAASSAISLGVPMPDIYGAGPRSQRPIAIRLACSWGEYGLTSVR